VGIGRVGDAKIGATCVAGVNCGVAVVGGICGVGVTVGATPGVPQRGHGAPGAGAP
jgi:hypothetical protein